MNKSVALKLGGDIGKIEKLPAGENGQEQVRFSLWRGGEMLQQPLSLTEKELIALLQAGVQEGVLSNDFISRLHSIIEI